VPDEISKEVIREIEPLASSDSVRAAAERVIESGLPALPVIDDKGNFAGVFGEREFMRALFPGYVDQLGSARMVRRSMEDTIERRLECSVEPIESYLTTDAVSVEDEYSDVELAELFLHHRVLIIPVMSAGRVHAVITRSDFFRRLFEAFAAQSAGANQST
jgi:CBS domain-containing protein